MKHPRYRKVNFPFVSWAPWLSVSRLLTGWFAASQLPAAPCHPATVLSIASAALSRAAPRASSVAILPFLCWWISFLYPFLWWSNCSLPSLIWSCQIELAVALQPLSPARARHKSPHAHWKGRAAYASFTCEQFQRICGTRQPWWGSARSGATSAELTTPNCSHRRDCPKACCTIVNSCAMLAYFSPTIITTPLICRGLALVGSRIASFRDCFLWLWLMCPQCHLGMTAREHSPLLFRVVPPIHQCLQMIIPNPNWQPGSPFFLDYSCPHLLLRWKRRCWPHLSKIQYWCVVDSFSICQI